MFWTSWVKARTRLRVCVWSMSSPKQPEQFKRDGVCYTGCDGVQSEVRRLSPQGNLWRDEATFRQEGAFAGFWGLEDLFKNPTFREGTGADLWVSRTPEGAAGAESIASHQLRNVRKAGKSCGKLRGKRNQRIVPLYQGGLMWWGLLFCGCVTVATADWYRKRPPMTGWWRQSWEGKKAGRVKLLLYSATLFSSDFSAPSSRCLMLLKRSPCAPCLVNTPLREISNRASHRNALSSH